MEKRNEDAWGMMQDAVDRLNRATAALDDANRKLEAVQAEAANLQKNLDAATKENDDDTRRYWDMQRDLDAGKKAQAELEAANKTLEELRVALAHLAGKAGVTAAISGIVTDRADKPVAGADVTVADLDLPKTEAPRVVKTGETDQYTAAGLAVGHRYHLTAKWRLEKPDDSEYIQVLTKDGAEAELVLVHDAAVSLRFNGEGSQLVPKPKR